MGARSIEKKVLAMTTSRLILILPVVEKFTGRPREGTT